MMHSISVDISHLTKCFQLLNYFKKVYSKILIYQK